MASALEQYVNHTVSIITSDGRNIVGTLKGFDQTVNLILDESHERVYSSSMGVEQIVLGLYIIRGDNVAVIGEIDEDVDKNLDLANIKAEPLAPVVHWHRYHDDAKHQQKEKSVDVGRRLCSNSIGVWMHSNIYENAVKSYDFWSYDKL